MKKVIVITGTSSGFGTLMVKTFSNAGHTVIATMRNSNSKNAEAAKALSALTNVEVVELDIAEDDSVKSAIQEILAKHKKIDVLVNNAAVYGNGLLEGYSLSQFQKMMDINVYGVLRLYNEILPSMRSEKNGLIINVSSSGGRFSAPFQVPYNATKFAIEGITEGVYAELIGQGIENVLIEPGAFLTELYGKVGVNADRSEILSSYGEQTLQMMQGIGDLFNTAIEKHQPNPQAVADAALNLINMEKGKRPLRTPVDVIADGIDLEYDKATTEIKARWVGKYGF